VFIFPFYASANDLFVRFILSNSSLVEAAVSDADRAILPRFQFRFPTIVFSVPVLAPVFLPLNFNPLAALIFVICA
jgi:hypothetical protein